jgi:glycosyltransferase involved in cell wall biosynthesis
MLVDIIMPTRNPSAYIIEAIDSCLNQSYKNIKLTVVDDASKISLTPLKEKYPQVNFLHLDKNKGPGAARNFGIKNTTASLISFLDDDDIMDREKIHNSVEEFKKNPNIGMTFGNYQRIINGKLSKPFYSSKIELDYESLMRVNFVASGSVTIKRDVFQSIGGFNEKYWIAEDYDCWIRTIEVAPIKYIHKVLYYYRVNTNGKSLTQREDAKIQETKNILEIKESSRKRLKGE